jgi:hypothetical protein
MSEAENLPVEPTAELVINLGTAALGSSPLAATAGGSGNRVSVSAMWEWCGGHRFRKASTGDWLQVCPACFRMPYRFSVTPARQGRSVGDWDGRVSSPTGGDALTLPNSPGPNWRSSAPSPPPTSDKGWEHPYRKHQRQLLVEVRPAAEMLALCSGAGIPSGRQLVHQQVGNGARK